MILSTRGYRVSMAASGEEGLEQLRAQPDGFDLVMTDLNMPGMGGEEVVRQVRAMQVSAKLIVFSGQPQEGEWQPEALVGVEFLRKPITVDGLLATVRRVVESSPQ